MIYLWWTLYNYNSAVQLLVKFNMADLKGHLRKKWRHDSWPSTHSISIISMGYTFMPRNKQSQKYLIGRFYKKNEFDWPFDLVIVTWKTRQGSKTRHVMDKNECKETWKNIYVWIQMDMGRLFRNGVGSRGLKGISRASNDRKRVMFVLTIHQV